LCRLNSTLSHKDACKKSKSRQQYLVFGNRYRRGIQAGIHKSHLFLVVNIFETKYKNLQQLHYLVSQSLWLKRKSIQTKNRKYALIPKERNHNYKLAQDYLIPKIPYVQLRFPFKISQLFRHICKSGFQSWRVKKYILRLHNAEFLAVKVSDLCTGIGRLQIQDFVIRDI